MVKSVSPLRTAAAVLFVAPVALLSACSPNEPIATQPGTTPPIWTGSPDPSPEAEAARHGTQDDQVTEVTKTLNAVITGPDGAQLAAATIDFAEKFATVTVQTTGSGQLSPGLHNLGVTSVGKCEPNSVGPAGGSPGDFLSAGAPIQSGALVPLQVRGDGTGMLVTTTDALNEEQLVDGDKAAIVIYDKSDTFAADQTTAATGDAGKRVACGVIGTG
ncbi:superoxide dismutase family protein [Mycobacterium sp. CVI_P3]|uniref:Superoxide dismutase [Cu-Zn] n=1 Tax=Mycobacterium pinniadriaticum TaxID=2994102 RepID=A0ABT3SN62_9MYCO|nr:superoxide dismutase family protein [Mycobacterium pinniadriaticum]MCX2934181.1 superoxide dismutase family protein [Mycobacterium pinniadriaticum]MCX2940603.1 superoxide dismutase family protein [Mycobacterium pinniadriaticum]